jgi:hypothetical protein
LLTTLPSAYASSPLDALLHGVTGELLFPFGVSGNLDPLRCNRASSAEPQPIAQASFRKSEEEAE